MGLLSFRRMILLLLSGIGLSANSQTIARKKQSINDAAVMQTISDYNPVWTSQSSSSAESMPCGGGDIGLNVWVEQGEVFFYIARSGTFDENNALLKLGRVRVTLSPNPFQGKTFRQELVLKDGYIRIKGAKGDLSVDMKIRADVFHPLVQVEMKSSQPVSATFAYESWRTIDRPGAGKENNSNSWKWAPQGEVKTYRDEISFHDEGILFYHRNRGNTVFDATVKQQGLESIKDSLNNPLKYLTFGGLMKGTGLKPSGTYDGKYLNTAFRGWKLTTIRPSKNLSMQLVLHTAQTPDINQWQQQLDAVLAAEKTAEINSRKWWNAYWNKSFIYIETERDSPEWQIARNYQLFRYMLGCNAYGKLPIKFNGGLFTFDPVGVDSGYHYTPDFRNWGGGTHTAQNQRLVYWPMLKSGDAELMKPQFDFYLNALNNAKSRTRFYWKHEGASFTEQLENFGLPNPAEYGWKRPSGYDQGMEYNAWLEYQWDTALEFCMMILETQRYANKDISAYLPLIENCLSFFDAHYQYLARQRGSKPLDANGHLVLYPGSAAETYKMAYNASSTIAGLKTVLGGLLELPQNVLSQEKKKRWTAMLRRIPPLSFREIDDHTMISPAVHWERLNNTECPQLYPVFPWGIFGVGKPGLDTARNTYLYDTDALKFRSHIGWKQDNIFAARLGLTQEAKRLILLKMKDADKRFPTFWGPGFDWVPDHNWGGSGMIGMQEMLMQTDGRKIMLFPAWPREWDTHFKLHAPYQTTVEGILRNGKLETLKVSPESRKKDIINLLN
jgi:hypothetical protein